MSLLLRSQQVTTILKIVWSVSTFLRAGGWICSAKRDSLILQWQPLLCFAFSNARFRRWLKSLFCRLFSWRGRSGGYPTIRTLLPCTTPSISATCRRRRPRPPVDVVRAALVGCVRTPVRAHAGRPYGSLVSIVRSPWASADRRTLGVLATANARPEPSTWSMLWIFSLNAVHFRVHRKTCPSVDLDVPSDVRPLVTLCLIGASRKIWHMSTDTINCMIYYSSVLLLCA